MFIGEAYLSNIPVESEFLFHYNKYVMWTRMSLQERNEDNMAKKQKKIVLDEYEKEILEAYENGMLKPSKSQADYQKIARNTMKKNRKINIRISENDLSALQRKAAREGIPYQTLIGSVLHKYVSGFLKEAR